MMPMKARTNEDWAERERCIEAYEDACATGLPTLDELAKFVPAHVDNDISDWIAVEIVRVDMERRWPEVKHDPIQVYREIFPTLFRTPSLVDEVVFEQKRLEHIHADASQSLAGTLSRFKAEIDRTKSALQRNASKFPQIGHSFQGFAIQQRLGAGAFGQVFLATQYDLHNRTVVLKVTPKTSIETAALAKLQHTNIVPIYSLHNTDDLSAICMPMLGRTTLSDLLGNRKDSFPNWNTGLDFISTIREAKETLPVSDSQRTDTSHKAPLQQRVDDKLVQSFQGMTFANTVAWIGKGIAQGLAHAHERGILHLDVKPANILIGDDGIPRLLDFHVAASYSPSEKVQAVQGGTLPYMSAEHLQSFIGLGELDDRADIFSLGVVLVQMLTGKLPFDFDPNANIEMSYPELVQSRSQTPSNLAYHTQASPGLIAIIEKCIAPLANRYTSMTQVIEDLSAHLENRPLVHVKEPTVNERIAKFSKRHPILTSSVSLVGVSLMMVTLLSVLLWYSVANLSSQQALLAADYLESQLEQSRFDLVAYNLGYEANYNVIEKTNGSKGAWDKTFAIQADQPPTIDQTDRWIARMPSASKSSIVAELLEWIHTRRLQSNDDSSWAKLEDHLQQSVESLLSPGEQQTLIARLRVNDSLYQRSDVDTVEASIPVLAKSSPADSTLLLIQAKKALEQSKHAEAERFFSEVLFTNRKAIDVFFFRGRARLEANQIELAIEDFQFVCERKPSWNEPRIGWVVALQRQGKHSEAVKQASIGLTANDHRIQLLLLRSQSYAAIGDHPAAIEDRDKAMALTPRNANEWVMRGVARMGTDIDGAKSDFEQAIAREPSCFAACQNLAGLYSERFGDLDQAIEWMGKAVDARPRDEITRVSRGVLYARQKKREQALADARAALSIGDSALLHYQVACIYSLLNQNDDAGVDEMVKELGKAMVIDSNFADVAMTDPDMQFGLQQPRVQELVNATLVINRARAAGNTTNHSPNSSSEQTTRQQGSDQHEVRP